MTKGVSQADEPQMQILKKSYIELVVSKLVPCLFRPEDTIIQNFEEERDMYIVGKGECSVLILDQENNIDP
jgi:hypothetical protein